MISIPKNIIQTLDEIRALKDQTIYAAINIWGSTQFIFKEVLVGDLYDLTKCTDHRISVLMASGINPFAFFDKNNKHPYASSLVVLDNYAPFGFDVSYPEIEDQFLRRSVLVKEKEHLEEWQMFLAMTIDVRENYDLEDENVVFKIQRDFNLNASYSVYNCELCL